MSSRSAYPHPLAIPTRWTNGAVLVVDAGGEVIGVCAESHCEYHAGFSFPETVEAGLRVARLGRSSVRYEIGLFKRGVEEPAASGWFVHVFVERESRRPAAIPDRLRASLERLAVS